MGSWWHALSTLSQVFYCIAFAATAILLLQTILLFFGIGDHDCDVDDCGFDCDGGMNLFTIRGIVAFFTMGGWTGVVLTELNVTAWLSIVVSVIAGTIALFVIALIMRAFSKMQTNGAVVLTNAIGKSASVYIPIHKNSMQGGKVTLTFQGRFMELEAVTDDDEDYAVGETVDVIGVRGDAVVITKPKTKHMDQDAKD